MTEPALLQSVTNALRILREFSYRDPVLGVSELARRLDLGKSTTHRLLTTLAAEGFVTQTASGQYRLGVTLWELGSLMVHSLELREVAHPVLEALRNQVNETVHLAVLDGNEVVYVDRFESAATLRMFSRLGNRMPAHSTSSGKAILAWSDPPVVARVIRAGLPKITPRTITAPTAFEHALERARKVGFVVSVDESEPGVSSVGAPVFDFSGKVVAGVSVAGPGTRMRRGSLNRYGRSVRAAADEISRLMGHRI
ncbi:MAG TPA: IclR family transcriptional regulator [Acidimicrobiales bacterium]|nr:IclR family transcriptional regulator [Acidimicrobiales bacterium]